MTAGARPVARLERFHINRKQKPLQHLCVVAFSDGKPDSTFPENALADRACGILDQSIETPLALIGPAHFSISLTTNLARYSLDRRSGTTSSAPIVLIRSWTAGVFIAATTVSWSF